MYILRSPRAQNNRIIYPHLFLDPAFLTSITSIKSTYPTCRLFLSNPLIFASIWKFSAYPVTRILYQTDSDPLGDLCKKVFDETLQLREFMHLNGLNYNGFGNSFYSIRYPMRKLLFCGYCGHATVAQEKNFTYKAGKYTVKCRNCNRNSGAKARDIPVRAVDEITLVRWDPELVDTRYHPYLPKSKQYDYYLQIPPSLKNSVRLGNTKVIANLPESFIKAIKNNRRLHSTGGIRHMMRPAFTKGKIDDGLGIPIHLSSTQLAMTFQLLMKHLETAIVDHTLPMRAVSPKTGKAAEYMGTGVEQSTDALEAYLQDVRKDPNFIGVVPPFDSNFIGGQVDPLSIIQDLQAYFDILIAGLGFPREFVFGGLTWSGSSVSLRMLENAANDYRMALRREIRYIVSSVLRFLNLPQVECDFEAFKMADDLQRAAFDANLGREGVLSWETILEERDHDPATERDRLDNQYDNDMLRLRKGRVAQARATGEANLEMAKYQMKANKMMAFAQADVQEELQRRQQAQAPPPQGPVAQPQGPGQEVQPQGPVGLPPGQAPPAALPPGGEMGPAQVAMPPAPDQFSVQQPEMMAAPAQPIPPVGQIAEALAMMPPAERRLRLAQMRAEDFGLHRAVLRRLYEDEARNMPAPLPERRPPQRSAETSVI